MSYFSLNTGVVLTRSSFSDTYKSLFSGTNIVVEMTSMNVPFLFRYTFPSLTWRPFVNAGGIYSHHFSMKTEVNELIINKDEAKINEVKNYDLLSENMLGYSVGIGLQRHLTLRKIISAEVRMSQQPGSKDTFRKNQFDILIGFSL